MVALLMLLAGVVALPGDQRVERPHVLSITAPDIDGGILSEITWDKGALLKGDFTLPAWSDDGKAIAVAEKKDGGRRWDISVVLLPQALRSPR